MPSITVKDAFAVNQVVNTINSNGQAAMVASSPVVIASNQTRVPATLQNSAGTAIASLALGTTLEGLLTSAGATDFFFSTANATTAQLAASATFTGTVESIISAQAWSIILTSDQPGTLVLTEYIDAAGLRVTTNKSISIAANVPFSRCYTANGNYFRLTFQNTGAGATTTLNINTAFGVLPAVTSLGNGPVALNEINGVVPLVSVAGSLSVTSEVVTASGTITTQNLVPAGAATAGSAVEITVASGTSTTAQVTGTYTGALSLQVTLDGTVWVTVGGTPFINLNTGTYLATITSALQSVFQCEISGVLRARITGLAAMTGTATVSIRTVQGSAAMVALDTSLPAGTAIIGALSANQSSNVAQINAVTPLMGNGVTGTGSLRVTMASDNTANTNPFLNTLVASAAQGSATTHHAISAATTNATSVKGSAGTIGSLQVSNVNAAARYLKLYNKATAPTVGTDVPVMTILLPANANQFVDCGPYGIRFSTGIAYALTTGMAVADVGAIAATETSVGMFYT